MENNDMQAVIDAARAGQAPVEIGNTAGLKTVYAPRGDRNFTISNEAGALAPIRKRGTISVFDAASFNQVIRDNADAGNISIYLDRNPDRPAVIAILNGHGTSGPGWGDLRAEIEFRPTPQWAKWKAIDGKLLPQASFAEFVEDNLEDIADPSGASMLEIVTYLQATRTVNFKSGIRLSSGAVQFQNLEDVQASVGAGAVAVPETFTLGISPIYGIPPYRIPVRFRWRIQEGKLSLGVKLQRTEDMMTRIIDDVVTKIERGANVSVLEGKAPPVVSPI